MTARYTAYGWARIVWLGFLFMAVAVGALREGLVVQIVGPAAAHIIGTVLVVTIILAATWFFVRITAARCRGADFWRIGLLWTISTIGFEVVFFHFVVGRSWRELGAEYNLAAGRIWVLVPLATLIGPPLLFAILRPRERCGG